MNPAKSATLGNLLTERQIIADLGAKDRWEAIDELIDNLVQNGKIAPGHRAAVAEVVGKREKSMSTGIGYGIGVPHATSELIPEAAGAFGKSNAGIDFESLDGNPVRLVFLFLVPQGQFMGHLHTLANITRHLHQADFRQTLLQASSAAEMLRIIRSR